MSEQVLITGGGSGIGREFVRLFLKDGANVLVASLVEEELAQLHIDFVEFGDKLKTLAIDLSESDSAEALIAWCDKSGLVIDTLVNNAGFATFGEVVDADLSRIENMIHLNVITTTKLSALFGARMKERRSGNILNVGSTAGMVPSARFAAYGATKAYVNLFTFTLRGELAEYGVNVTCLTPGATDTKFSQAANIDGYEGKSMLKDLFASDKASSPAEVAQAGLHGMREGKAHVLFGKGSVMASLASHLLPASTIPMLMKNT